MISYDNPICFATQQKAHFFCCTQSCNRPAFACQEQCPLMKEHTNHEIKMWSLIEQPIRLALQLPLGKDEMARLQKQEKQLKIVIEELKALYMKHEKVIAQCKQRLKFKEAVGKILKAVRTKQTNTLTGGDMARLLKVLQDGNLFINPQSVNSAMQQHNVFIEVLIKRILTTIEQHRQKMVSLPNPDRISTRDFIKLPLTFDVNNCTKETIINKNIVTVKPGTLDFHPVFAKQQFNDGHSFDIEVIDAGMGQFMVGIAPADLRQQLEDYRNVDSLCMAADGTVFCDGQENTLIYFFAAGDKITVRRNGKQVEWLHNGRLLHTLTIPSRIIKTPLYPVCWIARGSTPAKIGILKFI